MFWDLLKEMHHFATQLFFAGLLIATSVVLDVNVINVGGAIIAATIGAIGLAYFRPGATRRDSVTKVIVGALFGIVIGGVFRRYLGLIDFEYMFGVFCASGFGGLTVLELVLSATEADGKGWLRRLIDTFLPDPHKTESPPMITAPADYGTGSRDVSKVDATGDHPHKRK